MAKQPYDYNSIVPQNKFTVSKEVSDLAAKMYPIHTIHCRLCGGPIIRDSEKMKRFGADVIAQEERSEMHIECHKKYIAQRKNQ